MLLDAIIKKYSSFERVEAVAVGGSTRTNTSDENSDIDIYVFVNRDISVSERNDLVNEISSKFEVGGEYFGSGDEYFVDELKVQLDVMFWNVDWFNSIVENVWEKYYPSNGYTTCFLYTLKNFNILYDKNGWLKILQDKLLTPYPKQLKENIIKRNMMLLKDKPFASYYEQIEKALKRNDVVSVNHRISAFLASYFDIIFAKNEMFHPGEKRLIPYVKNNCKILPKDFEKNITQLLTQPNDRTLIFLDDMVQKLKDL